MVLGWLIGAETELVLDEGADVIIVIIGAGIGELAELLAAAIGYHAVHFTLTGGIFKPSRTAPNIMNIDRYAGIWDDTFDSDLRMRVGLIEE